MINESLEKFIVIPPIGGDEELGELLREAEATVGCALYAVDFSTGKMYYASQKIAPLFGISVDKLSQDGMKVIVDKASPIDLPRILAQQAVYMHTVKNPDFDLTTILVQHFEWATLNPSEDLGKGLVQSVFVVLTFKELREFEMAIGFMLNGGLENESALNTCKELLSKIKDRHNGIYRHENNDSPDIPYLIQYTGYAQHHSITKRQRQVLGCLAKGFSTKLSAQKLGLSTHTIESHRKKLLQKFEATNTAELVKKASKVFWLE